MTLVLVQRGTYAGAEADIYLDTRAASAFFTAAHDYMAETGRPMPEIVEPLGGLRTIAQTTEMQWAFDHRHDTGPNKAKSDAIYAKYNMSRVSTARPAITGTHTTGLYFDIATAAFLTWILVNGHRYGITRPLPNDPNHCRVSPGTETVALNVTGLDNGATAQKGDSSMPSLFHDLSTTPFRFALAGSSPGTPANWLETTDGKFANELAAQVGASAGLSHDSFEAWKAAYLAPVKVSGGAGGGSADMTATNALLTELLAATNRLNPPG